MTTFDRCVLARPLANALRDAREEMIARWLERIVDRVTVPPDHIFPSKELLDHVPLLVDGIADYLEDPADEITADIPVVAKAMELGELRHSQGFDAHQLLKEYEILGGILFEYLIRTVDAMDEPCDAGQALVCAHRLFRSIAVIEQATTGHFMRVSDERVREREERLRGFNRALSHEMKNRIGAARGAAEMLQEDWVVDEPAQRDRFIRIAARNIEGMQAILEDLLELSRIDADGAPRSRNVLLADAAAEVARQLREFAAARGVRIQLSEDLPRVEVPAAAVELCLSNYISNGVKYRDPAKDERWVRVEGCIDDGPGEGSPREVVVRVRDNGLGVPQSARESLFQRFFRAHDQAVTGEEGTGLGLSIVRDTAKSIGGRAWAEFDREGETVFALAFPHPQTGERREPRAPGEG